MSNFNRIFSEIFARRVVAEKLSENLSEQERHESEERLKMIGNLMYNGEFGECNNVTNADIEITNPYAKGCNVQQVSIKPSTSADGWKYHKKNKRKSKK